MTDEPVSAAPDVETPAEAEAPSVTDVPESLPAVVFDMAKHLAERAETLAANEAHNAMVALHGPDYADKAAD